MLLEHGLPENCSLKYLHSGGERLSKRPPADFPAKLTNLYGPTECTVISTYSVVEPADQRDSAPIIGKPVSGYKIHILDDDLNPVPDGMSGEICIGGPGLARGYHKLPEKTKNAFVLAPFGKHERIYKTGDLGIKLPDGSYDFIGRKDFQVKIRGFRIELEEIESVIAQHSDISKCVVNACQTPSGGKFLAAYLLLKQPNPEIETALRQLCKKFLPDYMEPATFTIMEDMPLTAHNKIDRRALPQPDFNQGLGSQPKTKTENKIAAIWENLLKIKNPGIEDNFFFVGGHSLLAAALCLEIEKCFGLQMPIHAVFDNPTIRELAKLIESTSKKSLGSACNLQRLDRKGINLFPASSLQENMWKLEQGTDPKSLFSIPIIISFKGKVENEKLEQAFNNIVKKHESLRTAIILEGNTLYQQVQNYSNIKIQCVNLSSLTQAEKIERKTALIRDLRNIKFDLSQAPLFECKMIKLNDTEYNLLLNVHHIIFDGWSSALFFKELAKEYHAVTDGKNISQTPEPDYVDFTFFNQRLLDRGITEKQLAYWKNKLKEAQPVPELPFVKNDINIHDKTARRFYFDIPENLTANLKKLATQENATLFMVLNSILQLQLHRYTGAIDICTGTTVANRSTNGAESIIGLFINALPLRNTIQGKDSFSSFLKKMRKTTLDAYENQETPYHLILENHPTYKNHRRQLFRISMLLQNLPWPEMKFSGLQMEYDELGCEIAKLDIMITLEERKGRLHGWYEYKNSLFKESSIKDMSESFITIAEQVCANSAIRISEISCPMPSGSKTINCFIAGETGMASACAELLTRKGFYINGIFSETPIVTQWAEQKNIPCYHPKKTDMQAIVSSITFEYFFSIIYSYIIKEQVLELPITAAINYHDSPLPRYAGVYASTWAIINRERQHAISWHIMTEEIDAGDILSQKIIPITSEDNSASLNMRCTGTAIDALDNLSDLLLKKILRRNEQDLSKRSYYALYKRPYAACILDWRQPAEELAALVRALDFGTTPNPLGTAKFYFNEIYYSVTSATVSDCSSQKYRPGEIISNDRNSLTIATSEKALKINNFKELSRDKAASDSFDTGKFLNQIEAQYDIIDTEYVKLARNENFWMRRLQKLKELDVPLIAELQSSKQQSNIIRGFDDTPPAALFAVFLSCLCSEKHFDLPLRVCSGNAQIPSGLFANKVPFSINIDPEASVKENLTNVSKSLALTLKKFTYAADIFQRFPKLKGFVQSPFVLETVETKTLLKSNPGKDLSQMLKRYDIFLSNLKNASNLAIPLRTVSLLTREEQNKQLQEWNNNSRDYDLTTTYIKVFQEKIKSWPEHIAVKYLDKSLTYSELDQISNKIANHLLKRGVKPGMAIGVCAERSLEFAATLPALFKIGCAYLPLEPDRYPPERIKRMIIDSEAPFVIVCSNENQFYIETVFGTEIINIISEWKKVMQQSAVLPAQTMSPDDTAYIIFTSGSTGIPKGVLASQKNLLNHNLGVIEDFNITSEDRILQFGALGFDLSIEEIFPIWLTGGTLVLMPLGTMEDPSRFFEFINREKITILDLPTAYWHELVTALKQYTLPPSLRLVVIGGEKASIEHYREWNSITKGIRLINTYGPTETTIIATMGENLETIGRPVANAQCFILNRWLQLLPPNLPGELCIGGQGVTKGYLNRPEKTAAVFVENPLYPGEIIYKTGDLAKLADNGEIIYAGRTDNQIKFRGFRIELEDIESTMMQQPAIENAVVTLYENKESKHKSLAAYFIPSKNGYSIQNIKDHLQKQLPEYMIPLSFTELKEIPLTPNGKVNRKALPAPVEQTSKKLSVSQNQEPSSLMEVQIVMIFKKLLGINEFNHNASFFELGGDSLTAIRLALELEKITAQKIPIEEFYKAPSVKAFSRYLENNTSDNSNWSCLVNLSPEGNKLPIYLLHTTPGDVLGYVNLVKHLDNRPVFAIQAYGLNPKNTPHKTIPEMAEYYVDLITKQNPDGPYLLAGWCFGGVLAFEMAQQLKKMGKHTLFLGLIETYGLPEEKLIFKMRQIGDLIKWGPAGWLEFASVRIKNMLHSASDHNLEKLDFIANRFADSHSEKEIERLKEIYRTNMKAAFSYKMKYYNGKINLFQLKQATIIGMIPSKNYRWNGLAADISIDFVDGDHGNVLKEPHVRTVAAKLNSALSNTEEVHAATNKL